MRKTRKVCKSLLSGLILVATDTRCIMGCLGLHSGKFQIADAHTVALFALQAYKLHFAFKAIRDDETSRAEIASISGHIDRHGTRASRLRR